MTPPTDTLDTLRAELRRRCEAAQCYVLDEPYREKLKRLHADMLDHIDALEKANNDQVAMIAAYEDAIKPWHGVFNGHEGLKLLADCSTFWDEQPYGTRLYFDDSAAYLHRGVLRSAAETLEHIGKIRSPKAALAEQGEPK